MKADFLKNWGTASLIAASALFVGGATVSNCALSSVMYSLTIFFTLVAVHHYIQGRRYANWYDNTIDLPADGYRPPPPGDFLIVFLKNLFIRKKHNEKDRPT